MSGPLYLVILELAPFCSVMISSTFCIIPKIEYDYCALSLPTPIYSCCQESCFICIKIIRFVDLSVIHKAWSSSFSDAHVFHKMLWATITLDSNFPGFKVSHFSVVWLLTPHSWCMLLFYFSVYRSNGWPGNWRWIQFWFMQKPFSSDGCIFSTNAINFPYASPSLLWVISVLSFPLHKSCK